MVADGEGDLFYLRKGVQKACVTTTEGKTTQTLRHLNQRDFAKMPSISNGVNTPVTARQTPKQAILTKGTSLQFNSRDCAC